jgi:hypothetical protein
MVFCLMASFCVPHNERRLLKTTGQFRPPTYDGLRLPMTIRGGGVPAQTMAYVPRKRMGPPPRSFAADAHDCIMVRVLGPTEYKVVARLIRAPERGLPSDRHLDRTERAAVLGVTKAWLGPQSAWRSRATANLDSWPARAGFATKKPDPRSNKETDKESKKDPLDSKDPIQGLARPETGAAFLPTLADSGRQRPRHSASPAAKPRKVKDYSDGAWKPEWRRTAWWGWQDSNGRSHGYSDCLVARSPRLRRTYEEIHKT